MPSLPKPPEKPKARRGGRAPKPKPSGRDKALVCRVIVDRGSQGQGTCGQVLSNPKQANIHLLRQHSLTGAEKAQELASMLTPCSFRKEDGVVTKERDHSMKVMPTGDTWVAWCLDCGAWEQLTKAEVARISHADESFEDLDDYFEADDEADQRTA